MVHTCLKCTCNEKLAFPLFVSNNVTMLRLHMFLELNAHKLNYKLNEKNKWTRFWRSFHMWATGMTNIWICMTVYFGRNNYSTKFDNLVNWKKFSIVLVCKK